jgi:HAD superfamily hydrolase (TIGR01509 family)
MTKVFISHGLNVGLKLKLRTFIKDRMGFEPVILAEKPDLGLTVIEKLERYGRDCDFALILLTNDDHAGGGMRARQNVIHELGVFHGILGRDRVLLLKQAGVELFSNISGLIYKEFEGESIESVFEDIRHALESGSAKRAGTSVPVEEGLDAAEVAARRLGQLFRSPEKAHIVPSFEYKDGRTNMRDADALVASEIRSLTPAWISKDSLPFSFTHPAFPLVILGSPRYNSLAEALQRAFHLPYQFVVSRHSKDPPERRLSVLTEAGEELVATQDQHYDAGGVDYDYGIFLVATLNTGRKLFWVAGIHSAGTAGLWQYIESQSAEAPGWLPARPEEFTAVLVRVRFELKEEGEKKHVNILGAEALGSPRRASLKARATPVPRAVLCDLGDVLMYFDRGRTYRAIAHCTPSLSWKDVENVIEKKEPKVRDLYESGRLDTEGFCDELYDRLRLAEDTLPRTLLKEYWSDIFWLNREMAEALEYLRGQGTHLVLFSNTNPLHFLGIERDYPELLQLFSTRVLSYEAGSAKPNGPIFAQAIEAVRSLVPGCPTSEMLMVDDTPHHVEAARSFGMKALLYRSYPHFVWWARCQGLYIP